MTHALRTSLVFAAMLFFGAAWSGAAFAQAACASRGLLDVRYCDENGDLIADLPKDPKAWQNPATLVFSYTPVEDPAVYENVFVDFMEHLAKVTGKRVRWIPAESYAAQVEAMRSGRLHIAGVATGPTPYAVNLAGFVPIVSMQRPGGDIGYTLQLITYKDSSIKSVADLKGKRVAHVAPSSNSGDIAPRALFSAMGVVPGKDYEVLYSGKHDNSVLVDRLTVMENLLSGRLGSVGFMASLLRRYPPQDIAGAFAMLERVGLAGLHDSRADALSGGQRQRVGISRVLMQNPDVLLVDAPTASLDPKTARQIMRLIRTLALERERPVLVNIHDVALAQGYADRVLGLKAGRVAFDGPSADLTPAVLTEIYGAEDWSRTIRHADEDEAPG